MAEPMGSMMNQDMLQPFLQPYVRLAQRNMQLLTEFSVSPEMVSLWMTNAQKMFEQSARSAMSGQAGGDPQKMTEQLQSNVAQVGQSKAFAELVQKLMQSYSQFLFELAQTGMTAFGQEQAKLMGQMQQAAGGAAASSAPEAKRPHPRPS